MSAADKLPSILQPYVERALAFEHLLDAARLFVPGFEAAAHILEMIDLLERAERGDLDALKKIAISIGPGFGKSTLLQVFIAWFLGRDPTRKVLSLSASEALGVRNTRAVLGIMRHEDFLATFPECRISESETSVLATGLTKGGGIRSIGQSGTVTGFRANLILADDIQPDPGTETTRQNLEEWFRGVLSTRLEPGGIVAITNTRWRDDDLIGRLADGESANQWKFVNIPAILDDGASLWPSRWPLDALAKIKAEIGSTMFETQYLGNPVPAGGAMFDPTWFGHTYDALPQWREDVSAAPFLHQYRDPLQALVNSEMGRKPAVPVYRVAALDSASSTSSSADRSAFAVASTNGIDYFVEHIAYGRFGYVDLRRWVVDQVGIYRPRILFIENASSGMQLLDELRHKTNIPVQGVDANTHSTGKEARITAVAPLFEARRVKLPKAASWLQDFLDEALRYPGGRHDDLLDAVCLAVLKLHETVARAHYGERFRRRANNLPNWFAR